MAKLRAREKGTQAKMKVPLRTKEGEEGRRIKFAGRVKSGDQEDDFEEHSLSHIYPNLKWSRGYKEAAWPSGQRVGLVIPRSEVRVRLWPLAGFVLGLPEFKSSATLVNSQPVASCQLGFLILLCYV